MYSTNDVDPVQIRFLSEGTLAASPLDAALADQAVEVLAQLVVPSTFLTFSLVSAAVSDLSSRRATFLAIFVNRFSVASSKVCRRQRRLRKSQFYW